MTYNFCDSGEVSVTATRQWDLEPGDGCAATAMSDWEVIQGLEPNATTPSAYKEGGSPASGSYSGLTTTYHLADSPAGSRFGVQMDGSPAPASFSFDGSSPVSVAASASTSPQYGYTSPQCAGVVLVAAGGHSSIAPGIAFGPPAGETANFLLNPTGSLLPADALSQARPNYTPSPRLQQSQEASVKPAAHGGKKGKTHGGCC